MSAGRAWRDAWKGEEMRVFPALRTREYRETTSASRETLNGERQVPYDECGIPACRFTACIVENENPRVKSVSQNDIGAIAAVNADRSSFSDACFFSPGVNRLLASDARTDQRTGQFALVCVARERSRTSVDSRVSNRIVYVVE